MLDTCYWEGEKCRRCCPPLRKTITHGGLSIQIRESSNNIVGGMRYPRCVGTTGFGEVRKDGINLTRVSID